MYLLKFIGKQEHLTFSKCVSSRHDLTVVNGKNVKEFYHYVLRDLPDVTVWLLIISAPYFLFSILFLPVTKTGSATLKFNAILSIYIELLMFCSINLEFQVS